MLVTLALAQRVLVRLRRKRLHAFVGPFIVWLAYGVAAWGAYDAGWPWLALAIGVTAACNRDARYSVLHPAAAVAAQRAPPRARTAGAGGTGAHVI